MAINPDTREAINNRAERHSLSGDANDKTDYFKLDKSALPTAKLSERLSAIFGNLEIVDGQKPVKQGVSVAKVDATLDRKTGTLTVTDEDTGEKLSVHAMSGNGQYGIGYDGGDGADGKYDGLEDHGPIPKGDYLIGNGYIHKHTAILFPGGDSQWYKLLGSNGKGGYTYNKFDDGKGSTRGGINLHTGSISDGCLTVPSDVGMVDLHYPHSADYDKIKTLLDNTKPLEYKGQTFRGFLHVE